MNDSRNELYEEPRIWKRFKVVFGVWVTLVLIQVAIGIYVAYHFISKWW